MIPLIALIMMLLVGVPIGWIVVVLVILIVLDA